MNRNLFFIAAALLLWGVGEGMFFNFVPIYLETEFLLSKQQIGYILGVLGLFTAIAHIPSGHLSDRFGRRPLIIAAWAIGLFSTGMMWLVNKNLNLYLVGLYIYAMTSFVSSPLGSYVTAARGKWDVGTALALTTATFSLGMSLGPLMGGWLGENYGLRSSYLVASAVLALSTVIVLFIKRQPVDKYDPHDPPISLWKNVRFTNFLMVFTFAMFAMYLAQPLTPNFLEGVRGLTLTETGWIFSIGALGNSLMAFSFSKSNPRRGFLISQVFVAFFAIIMWKGSGVPVFMLGYFLLGGFRASKPLAMAQSRALVHDSQMGLTYGVLETALSVILIIAPPIAGYLFERDPYFIYPLALGLIILSVIISYLFSPYKIKYKVTASS